MEEEEHAPEDEHPIGPIEAGRLQDIEGASGQIGYKEEQQVFVKGFATLLDHAAHLAASDDARVGWLGQRLFRHVQLPKIRRTRCAMPKPE